MNYSEFYNEEYYKSCCGEDYSNRETWTKNFDKIADDIVSIYNPKTVLDAGCAWGYLVEALRNRGVCAYGIDVSEYAIGKVQDSIKPYCACQSLTEKMPESFPESFDLIISVEVIEHIYENECVKVIENLCNHTNTIVLSSSPYDVNEKTHVNVQQSEYWVRKFAEFGFFNNVNLSGSMLTPWTIHFYKTHNFQRVAEDYERTLRIEKTNVAELIKASKADLNTQLEQNKLSYEKNLQLNETRYKTELEKKQQSLEKANEIVSRARYDAAAMGANRDYYKSLYEQISHSKWWKLTKPCRFLGTKVKSLFGKLPLPPRFKALTKLAMEWGVKGTAERLVYRKLVHKYIPKTSLPISLFVTNKIATQQAKTKFHESIKFSILVPLYNTNEVFLREMIDSCINQTYPNFELCLADASDDGTGNVARICEEYTKKDKRIVYKKLAENRGISNNTNEAIEMATGDYISLLDHDDLLHPSALYENMLAITGYNADFIYTDELTFKKDINDVTVIHLKPDFAIDTLRSNNYICHFSTFSRELLQKAGNFNPEFDGSQDYDIILRLTEKAKSIYHVRKVMYYWRSHAGSVASDISAKPYCITAAKKALSEHLNRVGLVGEVSLIKDMPSFYRIKYKLNESPLVSIVIPSKDHTDDLDKCLMSILNKSTYKNYEIIVVENNSVEKETFEYYETLNSYDNIQVVKWTNEFNYSAINNFGLKFSKGEYFLFLNNDVEIITENWIEEMLMFAQRDNVGAVGAKLYYPDNTIQHAGIGLGLLTLAGHLHRGFVRPHPGYMGRLIYAQDLSGVTAACMLMKKSVYEQVGGFDPEIKVAFNDVDLCMKIRKAGYLIAFTPYAELYHYESKSRGDDMSPENYERFASEVHFFQKRWKKELKAGDPYLNPNFSSDAENFSIDMKPYKYVKPKS